MKNSKYSLKNRLNIFTDYQVVLRIMIRDIYYRQTDSTLIVMETIYKIMMQLFVLYRNSVLLQIFVYIYLPGRLFCVK